MFNQAAIIFRDSRSAWLVIEFFEDITAFSLNLNAATAVDPSPIHAFDFLRGS
jgi:hypothetical protein